MKTLICNYCKREFQAKSRAKLYCSSKCKREMALKNKKEKMIREAREKLEREKVECPECGVRFIRRHLSQKYCTPECREAYRNRRYPKELIYDGKVTYEGVEGLVRVTDFDVVKLNYYYRHMFRDERNYNRLKWVKDTSLSKKEFKTYLENGSIEVYKNGE